MAEVDPNSETTQQPLPEREQQRDPPLQLHPDTSLVGLWHQSEAGQSGSGGQMRIRQTPVEYKYNKNTLVELGAWDSMDLD